MKGRILHCFCLVLTAMALTALLTAGMKPEQVYATEGSETEEYTLPASGVCDNGMTWTIDEYGRFAIEGSGAIPDYSNAGAPWFPYRRKITEIEFGEDVTGIGRFAFDSCSAVKRLVIPDHIGSIGTGAFNSCTGLEDLTLPNVEIGIVGPGASAFENGIFQKCRGLKQVEIPSSYKRIPESLFIECSNLSEVVVPEGVQWIGTDAFAYCTALKTIALPDSVTRINAGAFRSSGLTSIHIPDGVTQIQESVFEDCDSLQSVEMSEDVYTIGESAFANCVSLAAIALPQKLRSISSKAFYGCSGLAGIQMPDSAWTEEQSGVNIEEYAFAGCSGLAELTVPAGWILGSKAFALCSGLKRVELKENVLSVGYEAFAFCGSMERMDIAGELPPFGDNVFCGCDKLTIYGDGSQTYAPEELSKVTAELTVNKGCQDYEIMSSVINSYLSVGSDGTRTRVEWNGDMYITVEKYGSDGNFLQRRSVSCELPIFGGYYKAGEYHFFVFGQENPKQDDAAEVVRVVKYDKEWNRMDAVSLYGANTSKPFAAGTLRATISGGRIYFHTCHEMYIFQADGVVHQANMMFSVSLSGDMDIRRHLSEYGDDTVSHSLNQFILAEDSELITLDHGDGSPRAAALSKYTVSEDGVSCTERIRAFQIMGSSKPEGSGVSDMAKLNATGVSVGALERSATSYLTVGNSVEQDKSSYDRYGKYRNIFVTATPADTFTEEATKLYWITNYGTEDKKVVSTPHMVKITDSRFLLMWTVDGILNYTFLNGEGVQEGEIYTSETGALSDCSPVYDNGKVIWYVTDSSEPQFYEIDINAPATVACGDGSHEVKLFLRGGKIEEGASDRFRVRYGETYGELPEPEREGYVFRGYSSSLELLKQEECRVTAETKVTSKRNEMLYAIWEKKRPCGDGLDWTLKKGVLTIRGKGKMDLWENYWNVPWANFRDSIRKVVIEDGVENIGHNAFRGCGSLEEITIGNDVAQIGEYAFLNCSSLKEAVLGKNVTSIETEAFRGCKDLEKVTFPLATETIGTTAFLETTVKLKMYGFEGSYAQEYAQKYEFDFIVLPFEDGGKCGENLTWSVQEGILTIRGTGAMEEWTGAEDVPWRRCRRFIKQAAAEDGVTGIGSYAFNGCENLEAVRLADSIRDIGNYAFDGCGSLGEVSLPEGLRNIGAYAFRNCGKLAEIRLPQSMDSIADYAFSNCRSLGKITFPQELSTAGVYLFQNCKSLESAVLAQNMLSIPEGMFENCAKLRAAVLPETVTVIGPKAFRWCSTLSDVTITKQVTDIGALAFYGCGSLGKVMLPRTVSNVTEDAFPTTARIYVHKGTAAAEVLSSHPCLRFLEGSFGTKLEWSLDDGTLTVSGEGDMPDWAQDSAVPWYDLRSEIVHIAVESGVTKIGKNAFSGCAELTDAAIADTVKAVGDNAFRECGRLTGILFSEGVTGVGSGMFYGCASLAEVTLPYSVETIAGDAFTGCPTSMVICSYTGSAAETYAGKYGFTFRAHAHAYDFNGSCGEDLTWNLKGGCLTVSGNGEMASWNATMYVPWDPYRKLIGRVVIEDGVTSVGSFAFYSYSSLESVTFPESLKKISEYAFYGDTGISSLEFPAGIESVETYAFYNCSGLKEVTFCGSRPQLGIMAFSGITANGCYPAGSPAWERVTESFGGGVFTWRAFYAAEGSCTETVSWTIDSAGTLALSGMGKMTDYSSVEEVPWHSYADMITAVVIDDKITGIGAYAFSGCGKVVRLAVPASVTSIGDCAFSGCSGLTGIAFEGNMPSFGKDVCMGVTASIYYPYGDASWDNVQQAGIGGSLQWISHTHEPEEIAAVDATCTQTGLTAGKRCSVCGEILMEQKVIPALGHSGVADAAADATCTQAGLTAGSHCGVCNEILMEQKEIPALGHEVVELAAVPATCMEPGLTEGSYCSRCDAVITKRETIPALGHQPVIDEAVPATCTEPGLTEGSHCGRCKAVILEQQTIPAAHRVVIDQAAVAATCTQPGMTEGSHCSVCGKLLAEQETIPALGHQWTEGVVTTKPTCMSKGLKIFYCTVCGEDKFEEIKPLSHEMVYHAPKPATCTKTGKIEYWSCSRCGESFSDRDGGMKISILTTPPLGHHIVNGVCTRCGFRAGEPCEHKWGSWKTVLKATVFAPAQQKRTCTKCAAVQTRSYGTKVKPRISLTANSLKMQVKQTTAKFKVTGMAKGDWLVSVVSGNTKILKVSDVKKTGTFQLKAQKKTGTAKLTFTLASGFKKTIKVTVGKAKISTAKITIKSKKISLKRGKKITLKPVVSPVTSQQKVSYKSSNRKVADVNKTGVITAKKAGTAKITVCSGKKKVSVTVKVP